MIPEVHDAEGEDETPDFEYDTLEDAVESQPNVENDIVASDNDSNVDLEEDILPTILEGRIPKGAGPVNIRRSRPFMDITNTAQHNRGGTAGTGISAILDLDPEVVRLFEIPHIIVEAPSTSMESIPWLDLEAHDFHPVSPHSSFLMDEEVFEGVGEYDDELTARPTAPCYSLSRYQFPSQILSTRASRQNLIDSP